MVFGTGLLKLGMASDGKDPAVIDEDDLVKALDRGNTMSDKYGGLAFAILSEVFKDQPIKGYENVVLAMIPAYEEIGYKRGRSVMAKLLQYLVTELKLVVKRDKMFFYDLTPTEADLFCDDE